MPPRPSLFPENTCWYCNLPFPPPFVPPPSPTCPSGFTPGAYEDGVLRNASGHIVGISWGDLRGANAHLNRFKDVAVGPGHPLAEGMDPRSFIPSARAHSPPHPPLPSPQPQPPPRFSWFSSLFGFEECVGSPAEYEATRAAFSYDPATGVLESPAGAFPAGRFNTPSLAELRAAGRAVIAAGGGGGGGGGGGVTLSHVATADVLALHAQHPGATFLAASGLNCLEFTGRGGAPEHGVAIYEHDMTQGPACALACAPGTVVRNYFAANSPAAQLSLMDGVFEAMGGAEGAPFLVASGYVSAPRGAAGLAAAAPALAEGAHSRGALRDLLRVGVQADTGVAWAARRPRQPWARATPGGGEPPPLVTQVYAAALSLGGYKEPPDVPDAAWAPLATLVLEAAYEGTLWAAVAAAARPGGSRRVFLTGLGLGVFGNKARWVAAAIGRAVAALAAEGARLDVDFVHFRAVSAELRDALDEAVAAATAT